MLRVPHPVFVAGAVFCFRGLAWSADPPVNVDPTAGFGAAVEMPSVTFQAGGGSPWQVHPGVNGAEYSWVEPAWTPGVPPAWLTTEVTGPASVYFRCLNATFRLDAGEPIALITSQTDLEHQFLSVPEGKHVLRWETDSRTGFRLISLYIEPSISIGEALDSPKLAWEKDREGFVTFSSAAPPPLRRGVVFRPINEPSWTTGGVLSAHFTGPATVTAAAQFSEQAMFYPAVNLTVDGVPAHSQLAFFGEGDVTTLTGQGPHALKFTTTRFVGNPTFVWITKATVAPAADTILPGAWVGAVPLWAYYRPDLLAPGVWTSAANGGPVANGPVMTGKGHCYGENTVNGPGRLSFWIKSSGWEGVDPAEQFVRVLLDHTGSQPAIEIRQNTEWHRRDLILPPGPHTIGWLQYGQIAGPPALMISDVRVTSDPFAEWAIQHSILWESGGPAADPDGDGVVNLLEYIGATDPLKAGPSGFASRQEAGNLVLAAPRVQNLSGIGLSLEESGTLQQWQAADAVRVETETEILYRVHPKAPGSRFFRFKALLP